MTSRAELDQVRKVLREAHAKLVHRFVAFVLENEDELLSGPKNEYESAGATERLNEFKDAFLLFSVLLSQVQEPPPPPPPSRECPECLERVPLQAKRCRACSQPLPALGPAPSAPPSPSPRTS